MGRNTSSAFSHLRVRFLVLPTPMDRASMSAAGAPLYGLEPKPLGSKLLTKAVYSKAHGSCCCFLWFSNMGTKAYKNCGIHPSKHPCKNGGKIYKILCPQFHKASQAHTVQKLVWRRPCYLQKARWHTTWAQCCHTYTGQLFSPVSITIKC